MPGTLATAFSWAAPSGVPDAMSPRLANDMLVDRCPNHGAWLDHGELGRLIGAPNVVELEAFFERVRPGRELPAGLIAQRERRQAERDRRQREIEEYRAKLEAERARAEAEQARLVAEQRAEEARVAEEKRAAERKRLVHVRTLAEHEVEASEKQLVGLREQVRVAEGTLADSRGRLLEIDRQLELLAHR